MKMIYSVPYSGGTKVIVGSVGFGNPVPTPGLHEHSGTAKRFILVDRLGNGQKGRWSNVRYPERPFMSPALKRAIRQKRLAPLWANSFNVGGGGGALGK